MENENIYTHKKEHSKLEPLEVPKITKKMESYQLLALYAQELVDMWPTITLRTLSKATAKIADLKEALKLLE